MRSYLVMLLLICAAGCTRLLEGTDPSMPGASPGGGNVPTEPPAPGAPPPTPTPAPAPAAPAPTPAPPPAPAPPAADAGAPAAIDATSPIATDGPGGAIPCPAAATGTFGQPCGACGGTVACDGTCTVATPPDLGQVTIASVIPIERTGDRSAADGDWFGRDCPAGNVGNGCSVEATRTGAGGPGTASCEVARAGRDCRCRVRWRADPGVTLRCTVTILARRVCDR